MLTLPHLFIRSVFGLNRHFHTLASDGVYVEDSTTGRLVFRALYILS